MGDGGFFKWRLLSKSFMSDDGLLRWRFYLSGI